MERSFDLAALLKNHEKKHKIKPVQFVSVAGGVQKRLENNLKNRRSSRLTIFDKIRNLPSCPTPPPVSESKQKEERRRQQLEKWKAEKEKQKKQLAQQKKKPFVTGVVHAPLKFVPPPPPRAVPSTSGRVTRSQSAKNNAGKKAEKPAKTLQSFAPKNATFRPPEIKNLTKVPVLAPVSKSKDSKAYVFKFNPVLPNKDSKQTSKANTKKGRVPNQIVSASSSSDMDAISEEAPVKTRVTRSQKQKIDTPKKPIPKSESSSEERLRSPKIASQSSEEPMTPQVTPEETKRISPCVTLSRGKANARMEIKQKLKEGLLDEDLSEMDSVEDFRRQLNSEITRLTEMCDVWDKIREQTNLAETVQDEVLGAVGQARLLMSSKLQQFAGLVERCAQPEPGAMLITPTDLHGFWDMVFMQIESVDMRFKRLEQRRAKNWVDEQPAQQEKKAPPKNIVKKTTKPAATSRLRDMIAAARKAKKEQEEKPSEESKTFEAGFFCVRSPVREPKPATPSDKRSLLKTVLSSEAQKASASKNTQSFAMLRASILSKTLEEEGIAPLPETPPTSIPNATPGRSILKSAKAKSGKKSIKVVLFDQSDSETQDQEFMNHIEKIDSGLSSMDIDNDKVKENKENSRRRSKLVRQDAQEDRSPVQTRSRRKSLNTPQESRRSSRKTLKEATDNIVEDVIVTPKRSSRRRKSANLQEVA